MDENIHEFSDSYIEKDSGIEVLYFEGDVVLGMLGIDKGDTKKIEYLIYRTQRHCKDYGYMYSFRHFVELNKDETEILSVEMPGLYLICEAMSPYNEFARKILPQAKEETFTNLFKFYNSKFSRKKRKRGKKNPDLTPEDILEFKTNKITSELKIPNFDIEDKSHFFYGKKVVITGTFDKYPVRNDLAKILHSVGADINTSISKLTDYVIVGKGAGPKKMEKIEKLGIKTISEEELLKIFEK